jgi:hypothetical protein
LLKTRPITQFWSYYRIEHLPVRREMKMLEIFDRKNSCKSVWRPEEENIKKEVTEAVAEGVYRVKYLTIVSSEGLQR